MYRNSLSRRSKLFTQAGIASASNTTHLLLKINRGGRSARLRKYRLTKAAAVPVCEKNYRKIKKPAIGPVFEPTDEPASSASSRSTRTPPSGSVSRAPHGATARAHCGCTPCASPREHVAPTSTRLCGVTALLLLRSRLRKRGRDREAFQTLTPTYGKKGRRGEGRLMRGEEYGEEFQTLSRCYYIRNHPSREDYTTRVR